MSKSINVVVQGSDKSGKGNLIALITHFLRDNGINVVVQLEQTHNKSKLERNDTILIEKLKDSNVIIFEQQVTV